MENEEKFRLVHDMILDIEQQIYRCTETLLSDDVEDFMKAMNSHLGIIYKDSIRDNESPIFGFEFPNCKYLEDLAQRNPKALLRLSLTSVSFSGGFYFNFKMSDGQATEIR